MTRRIPALPAVAAYAAGVQVGTLSKWVRRGHINPTIDGCYDLAEIFDWIENRRDKHRGAIADARYGTVRHAEEAEDLAVNPE